MTVASNSLRKRTNEKFILKEISYFMMVNKCYLHGSISRGMQ